MGGARSECVDLRDNFLLLFSYGLNKVEGGNQVLSLNDFITTKDKGSSSLACWLRLASCCKFGADFLLFCLGRPSSEKCCVGKVLGGDEYSWGERKRCFCAIFRPAHRFCPRMRYFICEDSDQATPTTSGLLPIARTSRLSHPDCKINYRSEISGKRICCSPTSRGLSWPNAKGEG